MKNIMSHLEEVKTLAKLNHENIVSYKQAWIEPINTNNVSQLKLTEESKSIQSSQNSTNHKKKVSSKTKGSSKNLSCASDKSSQYLCKSKNSIYSDDEVDVKNSRNSDSSSDIIFLKETEISEVESDSNIKKLDEKSSENSDTSSDIIFEKQDETSDVDSDTSNSKKIISQSSTEESNSSEESSENRVCQYSNSEVSLVFTSSNLYSKNISCYILFLRINMQCYTYK